MHAIVSKKRKKESYKLYEILAAVKPPTWVKALSGMNHNYIIINYIIIMWLLLSFYI